MNTYGPLRARRAMQCAALVAALLLAGCRTIWFHPQATAETSAADLFFCQHGVERSEWQKGQSVGTDSERAWALGGGAASAPILPGWKQCMVRLGWDTRVGFRSQPPWTNRREASVRSDRR